MQLSGIEIVDIAKKIETFGVAFYDEAARRAKVPEVRKLFEFLCGEEKKHERAFEKLLAGMPSAGDEWRDREEYLGYLSILAEDLVFPEPEVARRMAADLPDEKAALSRALDFEKESILYFHEMRGMIREEDRSILDQLIDEERKHLRLLRDLIRQSAAQG